MLVLVLFGLTSTLTLPAKAAVVFSDNLAQEGAGTAYLSSTNWVTASLGSVMKAYTLDTVTLLMADATAAAAGLAVASLYTSTGAEIGQPGMLVGALASPSTSSIPTIASPVDVGGNGLTLAPNATYWILLSPTSGLFYWLYTTSNTGLGPRLTAHVGN